MASRLDYSRVRRPGTTYVSDKAPRVVRWHANQAAKAANKGRSLGPEERAAYAAKLGVACR